MATASLLGSSSTSITNTSASRAPNQVAPGMPCVAANRLTSRRHSRLHIHAAQIDGGFGASIVRFAKQVQGALPLVGLISRLAAPEGGVGNDYLAYPEYCRAVLEAAPEGFNVGMSELEKVYPVANRRYVLLFLWMARTGAGLVQARDIMSAARRLRVTQDIEIEMDRFDNAKNNVLKKYSYMDRPQPKLSDMVTVAVDAMARLALGIEDGEPISERDAALLIPVIRGGLYDVPEVEEALAQALQGRPSRAKAYVM